MLRYTDLSRGRRIVVASPVVPRPALLALLLAVSTAPAWAAPTGGSVSSGSGNISSSGSTTTITQSSSKLAINWDSFSIASGETVNFVQPNNSAIALNRVLGNSASDIYGNLNANGRVFLINPNGILFGSGASVNVGGLVASTLNLSDSDFMSGNYHFSGSVSSAGSVVNQGSISAADGGYVVLLGGQVSNQGTLSARLGNVTLAAGSDVTLDFSGDGLLGVTVNQGALQALAENRQLIRADGGQVLLTAQAADSLIQAVVNNTGVIEARAVDTSSGQIRLLGDMSNGVVYAGGTLDASAPSGGNGGTIETSAAKVTVADNIKVDTSAATGTTGTWLIDPHDLTVAANGGDISGSALSSSLNTTNVELQSSSGGSSGSGDLLISDSVSWSANTTLTLTATNNVSVQAGITATGNTAGLVINPNTANGGEAASGSGQFLLGNAAITLSGSNPALAIAGNNYTVINDLTSLQAINASLDNVTYRYYALGSDIDAAATASWNGGLGFMPLGTYGAEFRGIFEGLGHTISDLTISRTTPYVGLIGYTSGGSVVRDVGLVDPDINGYSSVGGIVGRSYGNIENVWVSGGTVSGYNDVGGVVGENYSATSNSYSSACVNGTATIGGLAGASSGQITDSYASGDVTGQDYIGGLVGATSGHVDNAYASGNVSGLNYVGGLTGFNVNGAFINDSYATGQVSASVSYGGALVGFNGALGTVSNSFWLAANGNGFGENDGYVDSNSGGLSLAQASSAATYAAAGWDISASSGSSIWRIYEGSTLPLLRSFLRPVTVSASAPVVRDYDGTTGGTTAYTTSNGASLLGSLEYTSTGKDVGSYSTADNSLSLSGLYSGQNGYDISYGSAILQIAPATLTVTANNDSITVGSAAYIGGNGVTYSGFGAGDSAAVLSGALTYGGSAQGASTLGDYSIVPGGLNGSNYRIVYVDGILSVRASGYTSPAYTSALNDSSNTSSDEKNKSSDQGNVNLPRNGGGLDHSDQNSDLFLRIVNGGIRLPRGLAEEL